MAYTWRGEQPPDQSLLAEFNRTGKSRPMQNAPSVDPGFLGWLSGLFSMLGGGQGKAGGMSQELDEKRKREEEIKRELGLQ
jgi:hypothetical protein